MFNIPIKTSSGSAYVPIDTWLLSEGKLFIQDEINEDMACEFIQKLMYLRKDKPDGRIKIYVNSRGGDVNSGMLIYDAIKSLKGQVDIICTGMAASMGAVILAGGQKGRRYILPHSKIMIHEPLIAGGMGGSATSIKKTADSILETKAITNGILAKHTGKTVEEIDAATSFDNFMNAEEAVKFGICDEIRDVFL